ncbi:MAG: hypothetical protein HY059_11670 [Proteobacteria bacterium]|nr:hypothetical protein [Pseudomonadota bacterium]
MSDRSRLLSLAAFVLFEFLFFIPKNVAVAQDNKLNFASRQAEIINNASNFIELSDFSFKNEFDRSRTRLTTNLAWTNKSSQPIIAFEVVVLRYDPFNRPIRGGGRWLITGTDSGNWTPLAPGARGSDGTFGFDAEPVMTSVVFVRLIRFQDGTVWQFNEQQILQAVKQRLPAIRDIGEINPAVPQNQKQ